MTCSTLKCRPLLLAACLATGAARALPGKPDQAFAQAGFAKDTRTTTVGTVWEWSWQRHWGGGVVTGYWAASLGRWASELDDGRKGTAWVTQIGLTPVLRWTPQSRRWFIEAGVGANLLLPIYHSKEKRFSTAFNFGDHFAVGVRMGTHAQLEFALRIQHYSNAGIRRRNPGEDFLQLRYVRRF